jgi:hypothetical protein
MVAEHTINLGHQIQLQNIIILVKNMIQMDWILREAIGVMLHPNNMNKEDGLFLTRAWKSLICDLKEWRQSRTKQLILSCGLCKGLTSSVVPPPLF